MISIIVPAYDEEAMILPLYQRLSACAGTWGEPVEIIIVDDGSRDGTLAACTALAGRDPRIKVISFTRNFGQPAAITAGLRCASGDLVAIIDADLQDPPEELPRLFARCREGYDVVYAIRTRRKEGLLKRAAYRVYYRFLSTLATIDIPLDAGDFCVMSRRAVSALNALPERNRFVRGLRCWIGFRQSGVEYERHARFAGDPKYGIAGLTNLALDGIINFSFKPLRVIALVGVGVGLLAVLGGVLFFVQYVTNATVLGYNPRAAPGWTSLMLAILFLAATQLFCLGVLGEYIGRLFQEVKQRPMYLVDSTVNIAPDAVGAALGPPSSMGSAR